MRYLGIKQNRIQLVSDQPFDHPDLRVIEAKDLDGVPTKELLTNYKIVDGQICCKSEKKCPTKLKVAFITNWDMECGLASYAKSLANELVEMVGELRIFAERNPPVPSYTNPKLTSDKIISCWKRGEGLTELVAKVKSYDPDIVLLNHEFGLFPNARHWLSLLTQLSDFRVITIMHSIFPTHLDKTICEAAMHEIIVHLPGGQQALRNKGVLAQTHLIPHGCYPYRKERLWNLYRSEKTFIQIGFGLRYKRFEHCIRATALLKGKHPDIFFTAVFSESPFAKTEHQFYFDDLMRLIEELGVREQVGIVRGFQSDQVVESYLRTNQVAVFPYVSAPGHQVFGASGAARLAMAAGMPVISSSIPHFSDLPTIKADTPEQIAENLDKLFSDPAGKEAQIAKQIKHIEENSWTKIAQRYVKVFEQT
jgi:glycosyltransferase involved in cell wall biosynthesis